MGEDAIIVAIVFGSILGMITIPMLLSLAKKWIDRNNTSYDEEKFDRLAKAFVSYKKESQRRLQNLEAIITDEDSINISSKSETSQQIEAPQNTIEIKDQESEKKESKSGNGSNLRNMLRE